MFDDIKCYLKFDDIKCYLKAALRRQLDRLDGQVAESSLPALVKCGDATAKLTKGNVVEIVGGSEEEREAVRQWVQENHPEYKIT